MSAPDGFRLAKELRETFLSYLTSALPVGNHQSQRELGRRFYEQWSSGLFAGPLVEALPIYNRVGSLDDNFGDVRQKDSCEFRFATGMNTSLTWADVDHHYLQFKRIRDSIWPPNSDDAEEEEIETFTSRFWHRSLYEHQWQSFQKVALQHRNLIVATSTGSGKTECYLIPILYDLLSEPPEKRRQSGIRALLLYPMNALVEDQMHRLRQLLFWINLQSYSARRGLRPITFGRYTGATPVVSTDRNPERHVSVEAMQGLGELVYRTEMQTQPPDILVTNFTMLEYILLRGDDQQLFQHPELFRFLVLDEVHTYTGTQGMEVGLLLRRLRAFLQSKSEYSRFQVIGTSATLPSGSDAKQRTAEFAESLFGVPFTQDDIIRPEHPAPKRPTGFTDSYKEDVLEALTSFPALFPALASHFGIGDSAEPLSISENEWDLLLATLAPSERPQSQQREDGQQFVWFRLASVLQHAPVVEKLRFVFGQGEPPCLHLAELSDAIFGSDKRSAEATVMLLKLIGAAHIMGTPILPLRFHMFVKEPSSAHLCLSPTCCDNGEWWSQITLEHSNKCGVCGNYMYPVLLCRRCGFAYLEGWRRRFPSGFLGPELFPEPDDADDEATYERILFRPANSGVPSGGEQRTLCLACGRWMVSEDDAQFGRISDHTCEKAAQIQVTSWQGELRDGVLEECIFCEQHWLKGKDVATPPAPSVYATATVLVEELERGIEKNGVEPFESKLISFSDSRQQAAQLAYRFQKTNREFTFRQLMWQVIRENSENGIVTRDLIDCLCREARDNARLRRLIVDDDRQVNNRAELERSISTLLFRESVTAYLTLEAQGIVKLSYGSMRDGGLAQIMHADWRLFSRLTDVEQQAFLLFLLDWNLRFRFAIGPFPQSGTDVNWGWLEQRNIFLKTSVRANANSARGELPFVVSMATSRNRAFNFCERLYRRVKADQFSPQFSLSELRQTLFAVWDEVLLDSAREANESSALFNIGREDADGALLKVNFDALRWSSVKDDEGVFRCDACGRISRYSVRGVCPLRDCNGTLRIVNGNQLDNEQFSPVRHYRQLIRNRNIRPLRVEEHTAQVAATKRQVIEKEFRLTGSDSVDVICGSTTFELGIDLGTIHAVFMSNLPPRLANYRQRAGRAGRRCGMVPFILSYVRQRPHDQYFWTRLREFIAGVVPVPRLAISSQEVIARHENALIMRELLMRYSEERHEKLPLDGPPAATFVGIVLSKSQLEAMEQELTRVSGRLRREFEAAFGCLASADRPVAAAARLRDRLVALQRTYLPLRANDGAISVLSDYGILPSYAFPLYVDELRLNHEPGDRPPRADLKLQRDRRIALQEYMPGKVIVAGKTMIVSEGLWEGFEERPFRVCTNHDCQVMDFSENAPHVCPVCHQNRNTRTAVLPRGGFFGARVESVADQDDELARQRGETYFDPANEPPPSYEPYGEAIRAAIIGSRIMAQGASRPRMRQFNPRPYSEQTLEMAPSFERDLALPNLPAARCLKRSTGQASRRYYLMHEFPTDIVRIQLIHNEVGALLASATEFQRLLANNSENARRRYYWDCFRRSLGEAIVASASRILDIDSAELGITFHPASNVVGEKEFIIYDTATGGAGYAPQLVTHLEEVFKFAEKLLTSCKCGDSCYGCLRNYSNQMFHRRLNRFYVRDGLHAFNSRNWTVVAKTQPKVGNRVL